VTLFEELRSDLKSSSETESGWDLSAASIAERDTTVLALLDKWETEVDEQEQTET
jgi:hypothetical protein